MLIMPMIYKNKILKFSINFTSITKIHEKLNLTNVKANDIIVGTTSFSDSIFNTKNQDAKDIVEFIRDTNINNQGDYFITTKFLADSPTYDIYQIKYPPNKVTDGLDNLYGSVVLDIKNKIPDTTKGKYIDIKKIGITKHITDEKLKLLEYIAGEINKGKEDNYHKMIIEEDLESLLETLEFIKLFSIDIIKDATIDIESFEKVLHSMSVVNTREFKYLMNFYNMAKNNKESYIKLERLYNIVYNKNLEWINFDKVKTKIKENKNNKDVV